MNSSNNNPLRLEVFLPALLFLKSIINDKCMVLLTWSDKLTQTSCITHQCAVTTSLSRLEKGGWNGSLHHTKRSRLLKRSLRSAAPTDHGLGKSEAKVTGPFVKKGAHLRIFYLGLLWGVVNKFKAFWTHWRSQVDIRHKLSLSHHRIME